MQRLWTPFIGFSSDLEYRAFLTHLENAVARGEAREAKPQKWLLHPVDEGDGRWFRRLGQTWRLIEPEGKSRGRWQHVQLWNRLLYPYR